MKFTTENIINEYCELIKTISELEEITMEKAYNELIKILSIKLFMGTEEYSVLKLETRFVVEERIAELLPVIIDSRCNVLFEAYIRVVNKNSFLIDKVNCDILTLNEAEESFPQIVSIECVDNPQSIIDVSNKLNDNVVIYGICHDMDLYHINLINIKMFELPAFILYIDKKVKDTIDLETSSTNWQFANKWVPVRGTLLK